MATTVVGVASVKKTMNYGPGAGIDVTGPAPPVAPDPVPPGHTPVVVTIEAGTGYGVVNYYFGFRAGVDSFSLYVFFFLCWWRGDC